MCNISAYTGYREASPILIEMTKKQHYYDGGLSFGIATVHGGRIYSYKMTGTYEDFLKNIDKFYLPGTVGLMHTRPAGDSADFAHPFISYDGQLAAVLNGTTYVDKYFKRRCEAVRMLEERGIDFKARAPEGYESYPRLCGGTPVALTEAIASYTALGVSEGKSIGKAFSEAGESFYTESCCLLMSSEDEGSIYAYRISRPMYVYVAAGECFMASCEFAFDDTIDGTAISLPLRNVCKISKGSFTVTDDIIPTSDVSPITPSVYKKAVDETRKLIEQNGSIVYDDIELYYKLKDSSFWESECTFSEYARLSYETLYYLHKKGLLQQEVKLHETRKRLLSHMSIRTK